MSLDEAVKSCLSKYATFRGRATRSEFWYWQLSFVVVGLIVGAVSWASSHGFLLSVFDLVTLLPGLAVLFRRLHDTDRCGWWWLIGLVPVVGPILLIVWLYRAGTIGPNSYRSV